MPQGSAVRLDRNGAQRPPPGQGPSGHSVSCQSPIGTHEALLTEAVTIPETLACSSLAAYLPVAQPDLQTKAGPGASPRVWVTPLGPQDHSGCLQAEGVQAKLYTCPSKPALNSAAPQPALCFRLSVTAPREPGGPRIPKYKYSSRGRPPPCCVTSGRVCSSVR